MSTPVLTTRTGRNGETMNSKVEELKAYALANYENGGHWIYETHDAKHYETRLAEYNGDVEATKNALREYWELTEAVYNDIANS